MAAPRLVLSSLLIIWLHHTWAQSTNDFYPYPQDFLSQYGGPAAYGSGGPAAYGSGGPAPYGAGRPMSPVPNLPLSAYLQNSAPPQPASDDQSDQSADAEGDDQGAADARPTPDARAITTDDRNMNSVVPKRTPSFAALGDPSAAYQGSAPKDTFFMIGQMPQSQADPQAPLMKAPATDDMGYVSPGGNCPNPTSTRRIVLALERWDWLSNVECQCKERKESLSTPTTVSGVLNCYSTCGQPPQLKSCYFRQNTPAACPEYYDCGKRPFCFLNRRPFEKHFLYIICEVLRHVTRASLCHASCLVAVQFMVC